MSIVDQAIRLLRHDWGVQQPLVEEIYAVLTNQDLPDTGASEISLAPPETIPTGDTAPVTTPLKVDPLPPWTFPALDLPAILFDPTVPESSEPNPESQDDPESNQNQQTKTSTYYLTVPGKITASNSKGGYTVQLYVKGLDGKGSRSVSVTEINSDTSLEVGTFTMVSGIIVMKLTTTNVLNQFAVPISTNTSIKIKSEKYYCQVGGGSGGVTPAMITAGTGSAYTATLYPQGPSGAAGESVSLTQLQIDEDQTIPEGTWLLAVKVKNADGSKVYLGQVPVWL